MDSSTQRSQITCTDESKQTNGHVVRRTFSQGERVTRVLKMAAIFLGATILVAFIPILHFVLVPVFLILAVIFSLNTWNEKGEIIEGEVDCPQCATKVSFAKEVDSWPKAQRCQKCSALLNFTIS